MAAICNRCIQDHPEWENGHVVFGYVVVQDMHTMDAITRRPTHVNRSPDINVTMLDVPLSFSLRGGS